jgi:hypothetical protein
MNNKNRTSNTQNKKNSNTHQNIENFFTANNNTSTESNSSTILIIILIILLVVSLSVAIYYLVKYIKRKSSSNKLNTEQQQIEPTNELKQSSINKNEVFHIANNKFTYGDAELVCKAAGAELATEEQLADAYEKGANWCSYGWVKSDDGKSRAYYPIQQDFFNRIQNDETLGLKDQCGVPGINGGVFDKDVLFGVNCYGVKREPTTKETELTASLTSGDIVDSQLSKYKAELADAIFAPFAPGKWSGL